MFLIIKTNLTFNILKETIFFFDFDNYDDAIANGFLHIGLGTRYVNFFQTYDFIPDSTTAEIISITDVTSISKLSSKIMI